MIAVITIGVSGAGKTIFANQLCATEDYVNINRDEIRCAIAGKAGWKTYRFNKDNEAAVTKRCEEKLFDAAFNEQNVIISDTNLNPVFRNKLIETLKNYGYEVEIKEFPISFQEACRRDKERGVFAVGEIVLGKQWCDWLRYWEDKQQGAW